MLKKKILIIIPAYNESKNIQRVIEGSKPFGFDIIVVNDCSTDDTITKARESGVKVISNPINLGAGGALQTGYKYAVENGYEFIVNLDGDGQHDPAHIEEMIEQILNGQADLVVGSRFMHNESYHPPIARRIGMSMFSYIAKVITGQKITDTTSGYKAMTKDVAAVFVSPAYPCDYPDVDTLIYLHFRGFRIKEVPVRMYANNEKSIHSGIIRPIYYVFKMTLSIIMTVLREASIWKSTKKVGTYTKTIGVGGVK